jgi:voltage-gated sodium channel
MTFEDWTDVMYETMEVYPLSWLFYLTFIFFTAFAFLNMVIGIVVNVMEQENANARAEAMEEEGEPSLKDISEQISKLQQQILSINNGKSTKG